LLKQNGYVYKTVELMASQDAQAILGLDKKEKE